MVGQELSRVINLVVTCSNRKKLEPLSSCQARNLAGGTTHDRAKLWSERLSDQPNAIAATDVYSGDHWSVVRSIPRTRGSQVVNVWVASAGYGLISAESKIVAYGATLSGGHLDSVASNSKERREWWTSLVEDEAPRVAPPTKRSLREVAESFSGSPLVVTGSPDYVDAMALDILAASQFLKDEALLTVLCRNGGAPDEVKPFTVYLGASVSGLLGGALTSLNARAVRWLIHVCQAPLTRGNISSQISGLSLSSPPRQVPRRLKLTDSDVVEQIKCSEAVQTLSQSALLKHLRGRGFAVEQGRFGRIYQQFRETQHGDK